MNYSRRWFQFSLRTLLLFVMVAGILFGCIAWDLKIIRERRAAFARIPIQSRGLFAHTEVLAKANFLGCYFSDVPVNYRPGAEPRRAPEDQRWWADARRVIAHPGFGPPRLPEPPLVVASEPPL